MNKVFLIGRLVRDNIIQTTKNNKPYILNNIAIIENGAPTRFIDFAVFDNRLVEFMSSYLVKGSLILLEAHIEQFNCINKQNENVSKISIVVDKVQALGSLSIKPSENEPTKDINVNVSSNNRTKTYEEIMKSPETLK